MFSVGKPSRTVYSQEPKRQTFRCMISLRTKTERESPNNEQGLNGVYHFWTDVIRSSQDSDCPLLLGLSAHDFADSEISNLDIVLFGQEDICRFQVSATSHFVSCITPNEDYIIKRKMTIEQTIGPIFFPQIAEYTTR